MPPRQLARLVATIRLCPRYQIVLYSTLVFIVVYGLFHIAAQQDTFSMFPDNFNSIEADVPAHVWEERAGKVKAAFLHAYHGYEKYAASKDELLPLSKAGINNFNGWSLTVFDALDTMVLMGLEDEYNRALPIISQANFTISKNGFSPYFETVIRFLGGLLSAYALTHNHMLLERADELAMKLDPIFDSPSHLPFFSVNPTTKEHMGPQIGILAEIASLQLEYTYLAKLTGKKEHFTRANNVIKTLAAANLSFTGGMSPVLWNISSGEPHDYHLSVGAQADSAHEYLLKQYLLTAKSDKSSLEMYIRATTHIINNLLFLSPTRHLLYVTDTRSPTNERDAQPSELFEHLSCFLPGLLALGAHTLPLDKLDTLGINFNQLGSEHLFGHAGKGYKALSGYNLKDLHMWAAEGLAQTCWITYADQPTGLGPDEMMMESTPGKKSWDHHDNHWWQQAETFTWMSAVDRWNKGGRRGPVPGTTDKKPVIYLEKELTNGKAKGRDYLIYRSGYLLRPETVESMYIMWRVTGNVKWRSRAWKIFEAIEQETKTPIGYASLKSVLSTPGVQQNSMPSYFLAETLKYLYLLFVERDLLPLDKWVFNTEAHPFPVFEWTEEERERFGIKN